MTRYGTLRTCAFVSTWGIALGQALNTLADIGDAVGPS